MDHLKAKQKRLVRRRRHIRRRVSGTPERPRLSVYRSLSGIYAQVIDDVSGATLVASSTLDRELREQVSYGGNCEAAKTVGGDVARKALAAGVTQVIFDRGGRKYHGRVKALADAAREAGLKF